MRFFVSSTFQDLERERNILTDEVLPKLRKKAEERGVPFSWCDLRWGVSCFEDENILRICLKNIIECSPYFVGLIGSRYGSIPYIVSGNRINKLNKRFKGIKRLLNRSFSYTEIEIRYYLLLNNTKKNHTSFFFYLDSNKGEKKFKLVKYVIQSFLFHQSSELQKVNYLKRFIGKRQITHSIKDDTQAFAATVFQIMSKEICRLPIPDNPYQEIICAENHTYLKHICSNYFPFEDCYQNCYLISKFLLDKESTNDILIVGGDKGVGKTFITAKTVYEYCRNSGSVLLYFFLGKSRSDDTQIQILSNLVYQADKTNKLNADRRSSYNSIKSAREHLFDLLSNTNDNVVILIDGISNNNPPSSDSDESLYSLSSWIPDKIGHVRYILTTSDLYFPINPRISYFQISNTTNGINSFIVEYWEKHYSSSRKNLFQLLKVESVNGLNTILKAKIVIDEYVCGNYEDCDNLIKHTYSSIYRRLCHDLYENAKISPSYLSGIRRALNYLLMSKYGLKENDIKRLCLIDKEWTILFYYIYPLLDSFGKIKLLPELTSSVTRKLHKDDRLEFVNSLILHNENNIYTKEILYQLTFIRGNRFLEFLAKEDTFNYLYNTDRWLLLKYIKEIDKNGQIEELFSLIKNNSREINENKLAILFSNAGFFFTYSYLKIHSAEVFVKEAITLLEYSLLNIELWRQCNLTLVHINIYKGKINEAVSVFEKIERRINKNIYGKIEYYRMIFEKAFIFDNYYSPYLYRNNAAEYYNSIINNISPQDEIEILLFSIYKYLLLPETEKSYRIKLASQFVAIYNTIHIGSRSFYRFYAKNRLCELCVMSSEKNISSVILDSSLLEFDEVLNQAESLGYHNELYQCLFDIIEIFNILPIGSNNVLASYYQKYTQRLLNVVLQYFGSYSLEYALLLQHKIKLLADEMQELIDKSLFGGGTTLQLTNRETVEKANRYQDNLLCLYSKIEIDYKSTRTFARLKHNLALIYLSDSEFEKAISEIDESIRIKRYHLSESDKSIYNSEYRKLLILYANCLYYKDRGVKLTCRTSCVLIFDSYLNEITNKCYQLEDLTMEERNNRLRKFTILKKRLSKNIHKDVIITS